MRGTIPATAFSTGEPLHEKRLVGDDPGLRLLATIGSEVRDA